MAELRCEGLSASYRARSVLRGIDLRVPEATLTAILGASGSGKTTLLRAVTGFMRIDEGSIRVGGTLVAEGSGVHVSPEKRGVGYVAQEGALYPHLDVAQNIGFGLVRPERKASIRTHQMLELVGLDASYSHRRVHELSGGEQRRVALARALAPRPRLVLLDEPFSGLDASLRVETREAVLQALGEERTTAVLVTHDQAEALSMGHAVAVLREGRLVQIATPEDLYRTPADLDVARFVGDAVVLRGEARSGRVRCALGELPVLDSGIAGSVYAVIRPEQIRLRRTDAHLPRSAGADSQPVARVVGRTYYGSDVVVRLSLSMCEDEDDGNEEDEDIVAARTAAHEAPAVGEIVELAVSGSVVVYSA